MKRAYRKAGLSDNYKAVLAAAKGYNSWQQGAHLLFSSQYNTSRKKIIESDIEDVSIRSDSTGENSWKSS